MRRMAAAIALVVTGASPFGVARADESSIALGPWVGVVLLDPHLADYRWDTAPRAAWGVSGLAQAGRVAGGARVWRASTRQATGIPGDDRSLDVSLTGVDGIGEVRLARFAGARFVATGNVGVARFAWSPRTLELDGGPGGLPVEVDFAPVSALEGGGGLAVRRSLRWGLEAGASAERSWFSLATSHRRGNEIVTERETFGSWTGRFEITRRLVAL